MTDKPDYMQKSRDEADGSFVPGTFASYEAAVAAHARTLEALDTEHAAHEETKAELQALREGVADVVQSAATLKHQGNCTSSPTHPDTCGCGLMQHRRTIQALLPAPEPEPDPLVAAIQYLDSITEGYDGPEKYAKRLEDALTRHGLTIAAIGGKHD